MANACRRMVVMLPVVLAVLGSVRTDALAWGKAAHRVVATLATSLLTPDARTHVADLLGPGVTLAAIST